MSLAVYSVNLAAQLIISIFTFNNIVNPKKNFIQVFLTWFVPYELMHIIFNYGGKNIPGAVQSTLNLVVIFAVLFLYECKIKKKILIFILYFIFQGITEIVSIFLVSLLFGKQMSEFYAYGDANVYVSCARVMYADVMMIFAVLISVAAVRRKVRSEKNLSDFGLIIGFTSVHFIFLCLYYRFNSEDLSEENNLIQIVFQTLLFVMVFIQYGNTVKIRKYAESEKELISLKNEMDSLYNYYMLADQKFNEISEIRHDVRNHVAAVRNLLSTSEGKSDAISILEEMNQKLEQVKMVNYCTNNTINAILTLKLNDDKIKTISTDIVLEDIEKLPFSDYELCSLFSNLFDNAAEACLKNDNDKEKFIRIRCRKKGQYCLLKFSNPLDSDKFSTVSGKNEAGHGYGLKIIEKICLKYDGDFIISNEDNVVNAVIAVPVSDDIK